MFYCIGRFVRGVLLYREVCGLTKSASYSRVFLTVSFSVVLLYVDCKLCSGNMLILQLDIF